MPPLLLSVAEILAVVRARGAHLRVARVLLALFAEMVRDDRGPRASLLFILTQEKCRWIRGASPSKPRIGVRRLGEAQGRPVVDFHYGGAFQPLRKSAMGLGQAGGDRFGR